MIHISEGHYHQLREDYCGICLACMTVRYGDTEPDAENYFCDSCELVIRGLISIKDKVIGIDNDDDLEKPYAKYKSGKIVDLKF